MPQYCAGFCFGFKAHQEAHIGICNSLCNAEAGSKDKRDRTIIYFHGPIRNGDACRAVWGLGERTLRLTDYAIAS
ncbi:MAG: hypothetical protein BAW33_01015 [Desulfobacterales bacterium C00003104]|nr:MAG: hypothetical protein BAW33_01015 [Desulfobacterales bacterium C00003104]